MILFLVSLYNDILSTLFSSLSGKNMHHETSHPKLCLSNVGKSRIVGSERSERIYKSKYFSKTTSKFVYSWKQNLTEIKSLPLTNDSISRFVAFCLRCLLCFSERFDTGHFISDDPCPIRMNIYSNKFASLKFVISFYHSVTFIHEMKNPRFAVCSHLET